MRCLQKVVLEIESKHGMCCENLYVLSDGMGDQFRSRFVPFDLISLLCGCTTNVTMGKVHWMVSEEP